MRLTATNSSRFIWGGVTLCKYQRMDYALYFGRFSEEKGIGTLIKVCKELPDEVKTGDTMELSMSDGTAHANGKTYSCTKLPEYMQNILNQGGLIASLNREEE